MRKETDKLASVAKPLQASSMEFLRKLAEDAAWMRMSMHIATEIRYQLKTQRLTQADLARRMGVKPAQITKILSGKENLSLKTVCRLEEALGCRLLTATGEQTQPEATAPQPHQLQPVVLMVMNGRSMNFMEHGTCNRMYDSKIYC